jgi:hypothetical protein
MNTIMFRLKAMPLAARAVDVSEQRLAARGVEGAGAGGGMEGEAIPGGAQRLVVGEGLRLEGPEPDHPLRTCGRRLTRHGRGGQARFGPGGILVPVLPKQTASAKVLPHAADRAFEHLADLAAPQVPEAAEGEIVTLLVPGAVEEDGVDVRVEPE